MTQQSRGNYFKAILSKIIDGMTKQIDCYCRYHRYIVPTLLRCLWQKKSV